VSTNPDEDRIYLDKPDTAFLTKAEITTWEAGKTFSTDWAAGHFFEWAELLDPLRQKVLRILDRVMGGPLGSFLSQLPSTQFRRLHRHIRWQRRASPRSLFRRPRP
jgi:hypothetical protein